MDLVALTRSNQVQALAHLNQDQVNALTQEFQSWYDEPNTEARRRIRGRHWLIFLILRFTGARLGEVLLLKESDIDYRTGDIKLITLKRKRRPYRYVPVPLNVTSEIARYLVDHYEMRDSIFCMDPSNFRKVLRARAECAKIPESLAHPHILRHTRAFELLRSGVSVTSVQTLLGHASLITTALYLKASGVELRRELVDRGML